MSHQDNDVISISDLLVTLVKYVKLWIVFVAVGIVLSFGYGFKYKNDYNYTIDLVGPNYIENGVVQKVISDMDFSRLLEIYYSKYSDVYSDDIDLSFDVVNTRAKFKAKADQYPQVTIFFDKFLLYLRSQADYISRINNWQGNIEFNLKQLQHQNETYAQTVKQFQRNLEILHQSKEIGSINGQALLNNLSSMIVSYQSQILSNDIQMQRYKSQLQTFKKDVSMLGGVIRSADPVGLTSPVVMVLGIILSLIMSTVLILMIEFIRNLYNEVRQKMNR